MGDVIDFETRRWQRDMHKLLDQYEETLELATLLEAIDLADKHNLDIPDVEGIAIFIEDPDDGQG